MDTWEKFDFLRKHYAALAVSYVVTLTLCFVLSGELLFGMIFGMVVIGGTTLYLAGSSNADPGIFQKTPKGELLIPAGIACALIQSAFIALMRLILGPSTEGANSVLMGGLGLCMLLLCGLPMFACYFVASQGAAVPDATPEEAQKTELSRQLRDHYANIVLVVVLATAFLSNPNETSFREWIMKSAREELKHPAAQLAWDAAVTPDVLKLFEIQHSNYLVCSFVTMKGLGDGDEKAKKFFGAFTFWWRYE